jgi:hypothetical protein
MSMLRVTDLGAWVSVVAVVALISAGLVFVLGLPTLQKAAFFVAP